MNTYTKILLLYEKNIYWQLFSFKIIQHLSVYLYEKINVYIAVIDQYWCSTRLQISFLMEWMGQIPAFPPICNSLCKGGVGFLEPFHQKHFLILIPPVCLFVDPSLKPSVFVFAIFLWPIAVFFLWLRAERVNRLRLRNNTTCKEMFGKGLDRDYFLGRCCYMHDHPISWRVLK